MISPFQFGRELSGAELVDRDEEVHEVTDVIRGRERLFLIGPRRYGKTSILAAASSRATELGAKVIRVNAEQFVGMHALAGEIAQQAERLLVSPAGRGAKRIAEAFASIRPLLGYDPLTDAWSIKVQPSSDLAPTLYLSEALDAVNRLAGGLDAPVAVIIDEFQRAVAEEGIDGERRLRAVVQAHRHVGYVFAGSDTAMLTAMTSEHGRPFYRLGSRMFLGAVPREDFRPHLRGGFERAGVTLSDEGVERILDLAWDVPYTVQLIASGTWRRAVATSAKTVSEADVDAALARLLEREDPQYSTLTDQLTVNQRKALHAAAHSADGTGIVTAANARAYGLPVATLRRALEALVQRGILRRLQGSRAPRGQVAFEDPILGHWVRDRLRW